MKITNVVDLAYLIRFCSAGAYLKYLWLCHNLRLGVREVVTKPRSDGISIAARGTNEVVNLDDIVLLPKLAKKSQGEKTVRLALDWKSRNFGNDGRTKK